MKASLIFVVASLLMLGGFLYWAEEEPGSVYMGKPVTRDFHSKNVKDRFKIVVYLPDGYEKNLSETYPVIYQLDGNYQGKPMAHLATQLKSNEIIPSAIVVGIGYYFEGWHDKRVRDYTYPPPPQLFGVEDRFGRGGGLKFLRFLERELIPYIDRNYRTDTSTDGRVLAGSRLAGFFTLFAMIQNQLDNNSASKFGKFIISSPVNHYSYNSAYILETEKILVNSKLAALPVDLYMAIPNRQGNFSNFLFPIIQKRMDTWTFKGFRFKSVYYNRGNHADETIRAYTNGLEFVFRDKEKRDVGTERDHEEV